jgi:NADPH-dependent 2,4-dienoyl-CoA reductase/sulfur reductase-like enzyme
VLSAIRKAVGPAFIVGVRMVADEDWDKGLSREDGVEIAERLVASGLIDFLNVIRGHIDTDAALSKVIPTQGMASAPHLDFAGEVRHATRFPVFHAARINDVATARHAIAEGKLDMVGMTRAHMADPHIALKVSEGREHTIRPCVGATYCLDRIYEGREAVCIHNPATGREQSIPHVIEPTRGERRKVVVVGAGPGGLEAARVSAERGHAVVLFEAADGPGGQIALAARSRRRSELMGIVDWRVERCGEHDVDMRFNTLADAGIVRHEQADVVIIATGGLPDSECLEWGDDLVISSWDILSGSVKPADNVLVYDDNGAHPGMQAAECIAESGASLEIITPERFFAPEIGGLNHVAYARCFQEHAVRITINTRVVGVERSGNGLRVQLGSDYSDSGDERFVNQVVVEHGTLPLEDLYFALKEDSVNRGEVDYAALIAGRPQAHKRNESGKYQLFRIGDAVSSRNVHAAIYDAIRLCKEL